MGVKSGGGEGGWTDESGCVRGGGCFGRMDGRMDGWLDEMRRAKGGDLGSGDG
jgi:hypothetical protein